MQTDTTTKNAAIYAELEQACEAARVLAAATLAGTRPFLGVFGARDALARTFSDAASRVASYAYLDTVKDGVTAGIITCDSDNYLARYTVKMEGR